MGPRIGFIRRCKNDTSNSPTTPTTPLLRVVVIVKDLVAQAALVAPATSKGFLLPAHDAN